jgi:TonB family protein
MNIESLAETGLGWLWRMSWQASVLVLLVFLAQQLFRRRLAPKWRFSLWWLVLLRLMLPVAPESGWSVFNLARVSHRTETRQTVEKRASVSLSTAWEETAAMPAPAVATLDSKPQIQIPAAPPQAAASPIQPTIQKPLPIYPLLALFWLAGVVLYGGRLCMGSLILSRNIRRPSQVLDDAVLAIFEECRQTMGVARAPDIIVTSAVQSPALFGLRRIKLLIPSGLTAILSPSEWRHIFMHELAHVRRRDVGLNWVMAALQALHWFNPAVWIAFKRMGADRELACDAMALSHSRGEEARAYGLTIIKLLEGLAKPVGIPGLVGILEDKSQIKQRIHMIAQYKPSQRRPLLAALLLSALCVIAMTDAQTPKPADTPAKEAKVPVKVEAGPNAAPNDNIGNDGAAMKPPLPAGTSKKVARMVLDGKLLWEMGQYEMAERKLREAIKMDPSCQPAFYYLSLVQEAKFAQAARERSATNLFKPSPGRRNTQAKLESIYLDEFQVPEGTELKAVIALLNTEIRKRDPEKQGVNFVLANADFGRPLSPAAEAFRIDPTTGAPIPIKPAGDLIRDIGSEVVVKIVPPLVNVPASYILQAITRVATIKGNNSRFHGIRFSVEEHAVVFSLNPTDPDIAGETESLLSRRFRVDPNTFIQGLESMQSMAPLPSTGRNGQNLQLDGVSQDGAEKAPQDAGLTAATRQAASLTIQDYVRQFFSTATGINFGGGSIFNTTNPYSAGPIRPMFFNDRTGTLYVRATLKELEAVEESVMVLNVSPHQINIETKVFEVPQKEVQALYASGITAQDAALSVQDPSNPFPKLRSLLSPNQFRLMERSLSDKSGIQTHFIPGVTTIDNRQCQIQHAGKCSLDILPNVGVDGYRITLKLNLEWTSSSNNFVQPINGSSTPRSNLLARISTTVAVWDGETAILACLSGGETEDAAKTPGKKLYIMCITAKIVDPAGNLLHHEDEMRPLQPQEKKPTQPAPGANRDTKNVFWAQKATQVYDRLWDAAKPESTNKTEANARIKVTIARNGEVLEQKITSRSADPAMDASVQRVLDQVKRVPPFGDEGDESQRTLDLNFTVRTVSNQEPGS